MDNNTGPGRFPLQGSDELAAKLADRLQDTFPWLEVESVQLHLALGRAFHNSIRALERYVSYDRAGLNRSKWNFLALLFLTPNHQLTVGAIARELAISPASVTRILDTLEGEGLAVRVPSADDRRITYAHLTDSGLAHAKTVLPDFLRFIQDVGSCLTREEKVELTRLLGMYQLGTVALSPGDP